MIEESAAGCAATEPEWPPKGVDNPARLVVLGFYVPYFFEADPIVLGSSIRCKVEIGQELLAEVPTTPLRKERVLGSNIVARLKRALLVALPVYPHVAGNYTDHATVFDQGLARRESRKDIYTQCFGLFSEPARHVAEAQGVVAFIGHILGEQPMWNPDAAFRRGQEVHVFRDHGIVEWRALGSHIGEQLIKRGRLEDCTRENMRANLRTLFDQAHHKFLFFLTSKLHEATSRREARGTSSDNQNISFKTLALYLFHLDSSTWAKKLLVSHKAHSSQGKSSRRFSRVPQTQA